MSVAAGRDKLRRCGIDTPATTAGSIGFSHGQPFGESGVGGVVANQPPVLRRPAGRQRQTKRQLARCQRISVSGRTTTRASRQSKSRDSTPRQGHPRRGVDAPRLDAALLGQRKFPAEKEVLRFDGSPRSERPHHEAGQVGEGPATGSVRPGSSTCGAHHPPDRPVPNRNRDRNNPDPSRHGVRGHGHYVSVCSSFGRKLVAGGLRIRV